MNTMIKILWIFWFQLQLLTIIRIIICLPWAMGRLNALYAWLLHLSTFFFTIIVRGWKNLTSVHQLWIYIFSNQKNVLDDDDDELTTKPFQFFQQTLTMFILFMASYWVIIFDINIFSFINSKRIDIILYEIIKSENYFVKYEWQN